jgi:hypothetical protein
MLQPRSDVPRSPAPAGLTDRERAQFDRQVAGLRHIHRSDRAQGRNEWHKGHFYLQVRDGGLWRRVPAYAAEDFAAFVGRVTGDVRSQSTVERRMALAQGYTCEAYLAHLERGVCPTVLAEIQRCDGRLRPHLLRRAERGLGLVELEAMRSAGSRLLRAQELSEEELAGEMEAAAARAKLQRARQRERRDHGPRGPAAGAGAGADAAGAGAGADAAGAAGDRALVLDRREAELAAREQQIREREREREREQKLREREPAAREQQLQAREPAAREQQLLERERELAAREQKLREREREQQLREREREREQQLLERERDRAPAPEPAPPPQPPPPREREPWEAALTAREAELTAREAALDARADQLQHSGEALALVQEQQAQLQLELDLLREDLQQREAQLVADTDQLAKDSYQAAQFARQNMSFQWPASPHTLDLTLLCMADLLGRVGGLARKAQEMHERRGLLPVEGGLLLLLRVLELAHKVRESASGLIRPLAESYRLKHPQEAARALEEHEARRKAPDLVREAEVERPASRAPAQRFHLPTAVLLGTPATDSPQQGVLGLCEGGAAALCLNAPQAVALFGQQGAGKSSTLLVLSEMALGSLPNLCETPAPLGVIHCHYAEGEGTPPPWRRFFAPNTEDAGVQGLRRYGALGRALPARRKVVYVPPLDAATLGRRREEHGDLELRTLQLGPRDLDLRALLLLMGSSQKAPLYMMKLARAVEGLHEPSWGAFCQAVEKVKLPGLVREIVQDRLGLIERLMGDGPSLCETLAPGDFVGLDLRAPWLDEARAMALFSVAMGALSRAEHQGRGFPKLFAFDEAQRYMGQKVVSADMLRLVREMRHRQTWVVYASQDPESIHPALIRLSSMQVVHRLAAQSSLRVLREQSAAWGHVGAEELAGLTRGEARVLVGECADAAWRGRPQRLRVRPSCAQPGGTTRLATSD